MSINNTKLRVGFVAVALTIGFAVYSAVPVKAQSISDIESQIRALQSQIQSLANSTTTSTVSASCSVWNRNLSRGSTGTEVLNLQKFLNSDSDTRVAEVGAGSPGNETSFYGPATMNAVTRFQEKYAANILTPLGLTSGTGGFYNSTRTHANAICGGSTTVGVPSGVAVSGAISVRAGSQPLNGIAVQGALRVPFTVFTVTGPADGRATIDRITIRLAGLSGRDNIDRVVLLDEDGIPVGNSRSINSDLEAILTPRISIRSGETRQFTVAGNISIDPDGGEIARLDVVAVEADTNAIGLPISGASHTFNDSIELPSLSIRDRSDDGGSDSASAERLEFDEDKILFFAVELEADGGDGDDDVLIQSISIEQTGSANDNDIDVTFYLDDEEYDPRVNNGVYTVVFRSPVRIDDGDDVDFEIRGSVKSGDGRDVVFEIDEDDDIFARDSRYRYGIPTTGSGNVDFDQSPAYAGGYFTIESGSGSSRRRPTSNDDILVNSDEAVLGEFEIEVEGEDLEFGDVEFSVEFDPRGSAKEYRTRGNDADEPQISSLRLKLDGDTLARSDRIEFMIPTSDEGNDHKIEKDGEFEGQFTLEAGRHRVQIIGDIDDEFIEGDTIEFDITKFDDVRGVETGDRVTVRASGRLDKISVEDGEFEVDWVNLANGNAVTDADDVVFGEIVFDATDSNNDVEVKSIELQFDGDDDDSDGRLETTLDNCRLEDDNKDNPTQVSDDDDFQSASSTLVRLDDFEVEAGEEESLFVVCDIRGGSGVAAGDKFTVEFPQNGEVEYEVDGRDKEIILTTNADGDPSPKVITITAGGSILVSVDEDSDSDVVAVGDEGKSVKVGEIIFEADDDDITINDLNLVAVAAIVDGSVATIRLVWNGGSDQERVGGALSVNDEIEFENLNIDVNDRQEVDVEVWIDVIGIGDDPTGTPNQAFSFALKANSVEADSDAGGTTVVTGNAADDNFGAFRAQRNVPEFNHINVNDNLSAGLDDMYAFSITAPDVNGDDDENHRISINEVSFNTTVTGATVANVELRAYENSNFSSTVSTELSNGLVAMAAAGTGDYSIVFDEPLVIDEGETIYFRLRGEFSGVDNDSSSTTRLVSSVSGETVGAGVAVSGVTGLLVWSPHSESHSRVEVTDTDWFSGVDIISEDRLESSTQE